MNIKFSDLLTVREASILLRVHIRTIQRLSLQGKIKAIKIGNQWRYKKSDIENYFSHGTDFSKQPARFPDNIIQSEQVRDDFSERRTHPRINCSIQSDIKVIIPQKKEITTQARILNISEGGVFLENCSNEQGFINIKNDDPINFNFNINNNKKLELDGRVLRTCQEGIAVKFKEIHHDKRKLIKQYVG